MARAATIKPKYLTGLAFSQDALHPKGQALSVIGNLHSARAAPPPLAILGRAKACMETDLE
jgi:hypothetical protein